MDRFGTIEVGAFFQSVAAAPGRASRKDTAMKQGSQGDVNQERVLLGRIKGPHGLKGELNVHAFTGDPADIGAYGALTDALGKARIQIKVLRVTDKGVIVRIAGVGDRTAAEAMKGTELWIDRSRLPETDAGEFYHANLIGLAAVGPDGTAIGRIVSVENYGAGDLLEIRLSGQRQTELVPFTDAFVPEVDIAAGRVTVVMPATSEADPTDGSDGPPEGDRPDNET